MPLNVNSATVTPQQALDSVDRDDSIKDKFNKNKIGDNQVLYAFKKGGTIKGNNVHSWFKSDSKWQKEKENAKNEVVEWIKGFGLDKQQTDQLVSHVEDKFKQKGELRGSDLKEIAKLAQQQLEPFASKPFVCQQNASPKEINKANLWVALNRAQGHKMSGKGNYVTGFTMSRNSNASIRDRMNVSHALFSMTPLARRPDVLQQQTIRFRENKPALPKSEFKSGPQQSFQPHAGATKKSEYNEEHDYQEAGRNEWKANEQQDLNNTDAMTDFVSHDGYEDFAWKSQVKRSHINLDVDNRVHDAELLEILEDELGDEIGKLDINDAYLQSLRDMMYEDYSDIEDDYLNQLDNNNRFVSGRKSFDNPSIIDDDYELED